MNYVRSTLTRCGVLMARPAAFLILAVYCAAWAIFEPKTLDWHGYATLATWLMTLFIQRAEHRDTQAIHAKLDELLRHDPNARTSLEHEDEAEPEVIERHRQEDQT
ncbi:low affinity Fe/Cu permease [Novosphingobium sp. PhB165]|uniref:low affinity iron permease family protein n=1 Tax=Novosphingobium sp. PhB165 TaxID=2485105 RepID=UPI0010E6A2FD|nr:low affinity iron permease family protein [Novosphingobium sp. PhB165]TCM14387.1 low affinity Fe/Cu permease [Novosphingobium sp. PhB165]